MSAQATVQALTNLEPAESTTINGKRVSRWANGRGWSVHQPGSHLWTGASDLPTVVNMIDKKNGGPACVF